MRGDECTPYDHTKRDECTCHKPEKCESQDKSNHDYTHEDSASANSSDVLVLAFSPPLAIFAAIGGRRSTRSRVST
jgi:hypothetical protein